MKGESDWGMVQLLRVILGGEQTFDWVGVLVVGLRNGTTLDGNTWGGGDI